MRSFVTNCLQSYNELHVCGNLMCNTRSIGNKYLATFEILLSILYIGSYVLIFEVIVVLCFIAHPVVMIKCVF